jgi:hypothetical protein
VLEQEEYGMALSAREYYNLVRTPLNQVEESHIALLAEAQDDAQLAKVPLLQPEPIKKREWVKKNTHGKANARGLMGAEIAGRELKAQERRSAKERRAAKDVNTPCVADPSHLDSPQAAPLESPPSSPGVLGLPASTAPARLQEEGAPGKRKRIVTQRYTGARHAGLLP